MTLADDVLAAAIRAFGDTEIVGGPPSFTERAIANAVRAALEAARYGEIVEAANGIIEHMSSTYKSRNGREIGIQGDDGEKCWIVHSDDIEQLRALLSRFEK